METQVSKIDMTNVIRYKYIFNLAEKFYFLEDKTVCYFSNSVYTEIKIYKDNTMIAKMTLESDGTLTTMS